MRNRKKRKTREKTRKIRKVGEGSRKEKHLWF
jgi:hypothetical protein